MQSQNTQLRVTLPVQLQGYLQAKASKFGLTLSAYVRNLVINDVKDVDYPVFRASKRVEHAYKLAKKAEAQKKLIEVDNLNDFLTKL